MEGAYKHYELGQYIKKNLNTHLNDSLDQISSVVFEMTSLYYIYHKYIHGSLILNDFFQIILNNINSMKMLILRPKHQNLNPKLNAPYFGSYII